MKISALLGKIAVSANGKSGYVISANVKQNGEVLLKCADNNEREFTVEAKNVISAEEKVVFSDSVSKSAPLRPIRSGTIAVDENGEYIGVTEDYFIRNGKIDKVKIGKKLYPYESLTIGDVIIVKRVEKVKSNVTKNGKIILKKGSCLTGDALAAVQSEGEYIQAKLKTL